MADVGEATGQNTVVVRLVNHRRSCLLHGYPTVRLRDTRGLIAFKIHRGGDQMVTSAPPKRLVVAPGHAAVVGLNNYRCDLGVKRTATDLFLAAPDAQRAGTWLHLSLRHRLAYCGVGDPGSVLTVSPFEPTIAAALRR